MHGVIFTETLRRTAWQMLYWGVGLGVLGLLMALLIPLFDALELAEVLQTLPPMILALAGIDEQMTILATPEGILAVAFFTRFSIIFAAYPVVMGLRITANEEDDGILDVLLALPVPRWRVILERFAAYVLTIVGITLMVYAGLWLGAQLIAIELDLTRIAIALFASIPLLVTLLAFTAFSAALIPRRRPALAVATVFVVGSFVLDTVANMVQTGNVSSLLGAVSVFTYFDVTAIVQTGVIWSHVGGLLIVAALLLSASVWLFQRRDVGL